MNDIELFLSGKISIEEFKALYKENPAIRAQIDAIITDDAKESADHPLWKTVSYEAFEEVGFLLSRELEGDGAFNGSLGDDLNPHGLTAHIYLYYHPHFKSTDLYEKRFEFYLDVVADYFEGPEVRGLLDSIILQINF